MKVKRHTAVVSNNISDILNRVDDNKASALIIDGSLGEGKTTEAVNIADEIMEYHGLPPIKFDEQLAMGGADFIKKLDTCYKKSYQLDCLMQFRLFVIV